MRIALVCPYDLRRPGGVRSHIAGLGGALVERGHAVEVIAPGNSALPPTLGDLPVVRCGAARHLAFGGTQVDVSWASPSELRAVASRGYDVMHFHTVWNPFMPFELAAAFTGTKVATFHDVPGPHTPRVASALMGPASALIRHAAVDRVIAVSPLVASYLGTAHPIIPNGITVPEPLPPEGEREAVLYVGRLEPRKSVATVVEAMAALGAAAPPLWIAGDGPLRETLERRAAALGLERVRFFGEVSETAKWSLLRRAALVVAPAVGGESFGIVLVEAMAAGAPPVAADNPGYRGVLADRSADLLFPAGDASALAERIRTLMCDAGRRAGLRAWGDEEWKRYDWRVLAREVEAIYVDAWSRRNGRRSGSA